MLNKTSNFWNIQTTSHYRLPNVLLHNKLVLMFFLKFLNTPSWNQWKWSFQSCKRCPCLTFTFRITIDFWKLRCHGELIEQILHTNCSMKCVNEKWRSLRDKGLPTNSNHKNNLRNTQRCEEKSQISSNLEFWRVWVNEVFRRRNEENEREC